MKKIYLIVGDNGVVYAKLSQSNLIFAKQELKNTKRHILDGVYDHLEAGANDISLYEAKEVIKIKV